MTHPDRLTIHGNHVPVPFAVMHAPDDVYTTWVQLVTAALGMAKHTGYSHRYDVDMLAREAFAAHGVPYPSQT